MISLNDFVTALYQGILGRPPANGDLDHHVALLTGGMSSQEMIATFLASDEYKTKTGGAPSRPAIGAERRFHTVDLALLDRYRAPPGDLGVEADCFTNWLGVRTDTEIFPGGAPHLKGSVLSEIPTVSDGVFGGYLEYASFLTAIESAPTRDRFVALELGAGWGPWISAVGVVCRRLGFKQITLRGVEADAGRFDLMRQHLARNALLEAPSVETRLFHAAAWKEDTTLRFPVISPQDHGGAATAAHGDHDYRGHSHAFVDVPALSLTRICEGLDHIDYMHWDLQGAELELARASADFLDAHVRCLFIGTHSRPIEGGLMELFYQHGWDILAEQPCQFEYDRATPSLEGMTRADGDIFAVNPRLSWRDP